MDFSIIPKHDKFEFFPAEIEYKIGDVVKSFQIKIPNDVPSGEYKITFDTDGDVNDYYSSIKASKLIVSRNGSIPLFMDTSVDVPLDGNSLEIKVKSYDSYHISYYKFHINFN